MIFGSEGLPRSGKSLEAMQHVVDSLTKGRMVVTNIHGINRQALSELLVLPLPTIDRLLITLHAPEDMDEDEVVGWTKEQFLANVHTDSLWIWDEINQFWPPDRQPLPAEWAKFVTEHGHFGIDILIMGQDLTELHQTWRKRLQRYTRYTKLDMMGKEDSFHWASYSNCGRNKFRKTADGTKPYNKKFFGLYKSHRADTQNKDNYKDKRFGIFQRKHKVYGFFFLLLFCYAIYHIYGFFKQPTKVPEKEAAPISVPVKPVPAPEAPKPVQAPVASVASAATGVLPGAVQTLSKPEPIDYFDKFASQYDLRLAGFIERKPVDGDTRPWYDFQVDVLDASYRVKERFNRASLSSLGWTIERTEYGVKLSKEGLTYVVRSWPLDNFGKVPAKVVSDLSNPQTSQLAEPSKGYSGSSVASSGMTVTVVEDSSHTTRKAR